MNFDLIFAGGGVGSSTGLINLIKKVNKKKKNKKIKICVVEKNIKNFPGGIAYGRALSENGFFNNPCRLSPEQFVSWTIKKNIKRNLIEYLSKQKSNFIKDWINKNKTILLKANSIKKISEIYYPRIFYSFWLENQINDMFKNLDKNIEIIFLENEIINIRRKKKFEIQTKYGMKFFKIIPSNKYSFKKIRFVPVKISNSNKIYSKMLFMSLGLPSPKKIVINKIFNDKYYIHDLYEAGSTNRIIKLIYEKNKKLSNIKIHFLGSKAGFLECLPELYYLIKKKRIKLKIFSSSIRAQTLNPAVITNKKRPYKLKFFIKKNIKKIRTPKNLYQSLKLEFSNCEKLRFNKYNAWTKILSENLYSSVIKNFNTKNLKIYNNQYFEKIRALTRFTYPETVFAKNKLEKNGYIKMVKSKLKNITKNKNKFVVTLKANKKFIKIKSDILVCVLGPEKINDLTNNNKLFTDIKLLNNGGMDKSGFLTNKFFELKYAKNFYAVGFHVSGYNPNRETIIKAITKNSIVASNHLLKKFNFKKIGNN